ncbi:NADPH dehydrogenase [Roseimaritima multifibrata]|uniref:NADPH dehydrogenase n=1 Tax=Roseimaritima multifibrata TaxID=1930274 RepID=A0A517MMZ4_9BACT|nr:NADH:flavin oxidoreductase [Roseimaritima multifibrata]QDS96250.1 NADPH dehydrogenase [Roseimaritima multifibrata]
MPAPSYGKIAQIRTPQALQERLASLNLQLPVDPEVLSAAEGSPLAAEGTAEGLRIGNRWCIHPMEGWDAGRDGTPSEWTIRRWQRFGQSGAKLIWGGEAAAVRPDGRANPNQTMALAANEPGLQQLRNVLVEAHQEAAGCTDDLVVGLQLTHSGRFCRPNDKKLLEPRIAYHHPILDKRFQIDPLDHSVVWTDAELDDLIEEYVRAAKLAETCGFQFVDIKSCHGYLLHEFLSARSRPGKYGGDLAGRSRLLLSIIKAVRIACPKLAIGVRLSLFDTLPYQQGEEVGVPAPWDSATEYDAGFGCRADDPLQMDLKEPIELVRLLAAEGVRLLNLSCGSPYYNPHIQRPAIFPPSDGYQLPEDPLCGVVRQVRATAECKAAVPEMFMVGSGYSYLQDYVAHVGQAVVREGMVDSIGLGRMVLSYPELPLDTLAGRPMVRKLICRTFSDCTTAPRNGMISGCFPLDPAYKALPERKQLIEIKKSQS